MRHLIPLLLLAVAAPALAQTPPPTPSQTPSQAHPRPKDLQVIDDATPPKEPAPPPPRVQNDPSDTKVTIRKDGDNTVEEYRLKGKLYKMRVLPRDGKPYLLIDEKGDGQFAQPSRGPADAHGLSVPMWVIKNF